MVALTLAVMMFSRRAQDGLARMFGQVRKVKGGVVEIEFNVAVATDLRASITQNLNDYRLAAEAAYEREVRTHGLDELMRLAVEAVARTLKVGEHDCRGTVHVPDVVFRGYLYQLLDYYPDESGRGRRWSERYGLLGRAWRLRRSLCAGHALGDALSRPTKREKATTLITDWGMTGSEAERATSEGARQSFLCIMLRVEGRPVGVLYLDAEKEDVFKAAAVEGSKQLYARDNLESLNEVEKLAEAVDRVMIALSPAGTYLAF